MFLPKESLSLGLAALTTGITLCVYNYAAADAAALLLCCLHQGLLRAIGVSNFGIPHLDKLAQTAAVAPVVNQIELHPWLQRRELVDYCKGKGIVLEVNMI